MTSIRGLLRGVGMRMMVRCGDQDCKNEFYVESNEPVWECPNCAREIINRNYPFLTARLMQAKIDGDLTDWKVMFMELLKTARIQINARDGDPSSIVDSAENEVWGKDLSNSQWKEEHDKLLEKARQMIMELESS
jgi:predicted RNA-binding Zn-ribbon protein involved in translation (DUF1610 family)